MPNKLIPMFVMLMLVAGNPQMVSAAGLATLFTTPQERQIINSNRYKSEAVSAPVEEVETEAVESAVQQLVREEVTLQYQISGITISSEGPHSVWINSMVYEDSELLEDGSKIKVIAGNEIRVRITAPDGKHHYATSGEIIDVTYLAPIEN